MGIADDSNSADFERIDRMSNIAKKRILVIDDEISVCRFLRHSLESSDFEVVEANNGADGLQRLIDSRPDLVILDFGLPDVTGVEVLKKLREWSKVPVIFLTVRDADEDKVAALDFGADDYLTKPFSVPELLARIRLAFRHAQPEVETPLFKSGALEVDRASHKTKVGGVDVKMTATEYAMICLLIKYAGKVVPHRTLLKEIWGPNTVEHDHYLRVYFSQIRKKLDAVLPGTGALIENESGIGYRIKVEN
jgi:two-component system KDP operon response regulator KdpE